MFNNTSFNGSWDDFSSGSLNYTFSERIGIVTVLVVIMFLTLFGNILVILSVVLYRHMRSITNSFVLSLAIADLLVALVVMPLSILIQYNNGHWYFSQISCQLFVCLDVYSTTASIVHLSCVAIDRYLAITDPFHYGQKMTSKILFKMLISCWIIPVFISFIPILNQWNRIGIEDWFPPEKHQVCVFLVNKTFALVCSTVAFYVPFAFMIICYAKIYTVARKQARKITSLENSVKSTPPQNGHKKNNYSTSHSKHMRRETKAAKTLGIIMGAFGICWCPFFIMNVIDPFIDYSIDTTQGNKIWQTITWLGYCNSTLNPMLYYFSNKKFRQAFTNILQGRICNVVLDEGNSSFSNSRES